MATTNPIEDYLATLDEPKRASHAPNAIDNFCFDVTLSYRRLERPRRGARTS